MDNLRKAVTGILLVLASPLTLAAIAIDDYYTVGAQEDLYIVPWANDSFDTGFTGLDAADFELIQGQGTIQDTNDGPLFTPGASYTGPVAFRYTITDNDGSDQAVVYIDVVGNPPSVLAVQDTFYIPAGAGTVTLDVRDNDRWEDPISPAVVAGTSGTSTEGGTVVVGQTPREVLYTPPSGFVGTDTFTYILEGQGQSSQTTVTVYVGDLPGGNLTAPGNLTDEEARVFDVVVEACNQNNNSGPCNDIENLTPAEQKELMQQISGRHAKLQARTLRQLQAQQADNIYIRLREIRAERNQLSIDGLNLAVMGDSLPLGQALQSGLRGGSAGDDELISPWGAFINGKISVGKSKETASKPSYDQDSYSVTLGLDYRLDDTIVLGAATGFSQSTTDFVSTQGRQKTQSFSLVTFGNYYPAENLYLDGLLLLTRGDLDVAREISVGSIQQSLASDTDSQQLTAATSLGYEFNVERWQSSLYGRLEYSDLSIDGYTETGGSFALNVGKQNTHSFTTALGTRVGYVFSWSKGVIVPAIEMELIKEGSDSYNISNQFAGAVAAGSFDINVDEPDTEYISVSASASAVFSGGHSAFVRYETLLLQNGYDLSSYSFGFRTEF